MLHSKITLTPESQQAIPRLIAAVTKYLVAQKGDTDSLVKIEDGLKTLIIAQSNNNEAQMHYPAELKDLEDLSHNANFSMIALNYVRGIQAVLESGKEQNFNDSL